MRRFLRSTAAAVLVAGFAPIEGSHAQTPADPQPAVGWIFTPALRFGGSWDDNILLAHAGDNPPTDYATPINPSADLEYRGRRTRVSSGYEGSFLMYRTFSQLNSSDHRVRASVEHRATRRLTVFAQEDFARVPTTDALVMAGVPFFRVGSQMNSVGGGIEAAVTRHTSLRGRYNLRTIRFEDQEDFGGGLQGGHEHEGTVGFARVLSPQLTIGSEYEVRRATLSDGGDRFNSQTGSVTLQYQATPTLTISGLLGVSRLGAGRDHDPRTGPAVRAAITRRAREFVIAAAYQRSFIPSFGFGGTFQNEEWQASVHVPFAARRGYVDGSVSRFNNDPLEATLPSLESIWVTGSLGYHLTRWLSVEGYYGQSQQNTDRAGGDLSRRQVGFRMRAAKPMRLDK